ncbi:helix-turn-helix domain-containing protein [Flavobacterium sp. KACC 22763]|uniref:helix-turn-helix domain-containing protein n=1 Tax=Flavobacterium sp. KACC 22763 TaxID=3025668 RepID=UPI0023658E5C|nr:helix-turn-helix domain-containing protein [Flavobacterium sp. KACC 22763]WDF63183.1 helix-turn-helix domain-containing protein [Flavobacterium sp. KACC 22763]
MEKITFNKGEDFQSVVLLPQKEILSFNEAVNYLDVSKSFLYKLTSSNKISFSKPNNKLIYFQRIDLDNWMLQNRNESIGVLQENLNNYLKSK